MKVGVLGGGQLGRMLALAGYPMGLQFRFLDPDRLCPAGQVAELVVGDYDDERALREFVRGLDVVTYEFENVPVDAADWLEAHTRVFPRRKALATSQDRASERLCFEALGIATPRWTAVDDPESLREALRTIGTPCILKTRRMGYDGRGQGVIRDAADADAVWRAVANGATRLPCIVEQLVGFTRELSILAVRGLDGQMAFYPPTENRHASGILFRSEAPATQAPASTLQEAASRVLRELDYVGVLAIEFFDLGGGRVLANEMAPRVHNTGHWTIEGCQCSQFENHIRAVCGMPLGSTDQRGAAVMLNVIGAEPDLPSMLNLPGLHAHLYGKLPRPGRKLGHVTICDVEASRVAELSHRAAALLRNC